MSEAIDIDEFTAFLGEMSTSLIACGCSSNRVENLTARLGLIFKYEVKVLALPTGCNISVRRHHFHRYDLFRIKDWEINLNQLSQINDLVEELEIKQFSVKDARSSLRKIMTDKPPYHPALTVLAGGWAGAGLVHFYGGPYLEMILAFTIGILVAFLRNYLFQGENRRYLVDYLSAAGVAFGATLAHHFLPQTDVHRVIIGGIVIMVPGLVFVNAIHEVSQKNLVSGTAKAFEAIVIALSLAFGVITIVALSKFLGW